MKLNQSVQTTAVLANANELVFSIAHGVLGNEVADSIQGAPLTRQAIYDMAQTQFQAKVNQFMKS